MKAKKKIKKAKDQLENISSNKILIRVFKDFGSNTAILKAEYEAVERRDVYNNLVSINKEYLHDEETDFTIDDVYHEIQIILDLKNKPRVEKLKILDERIKYQDQLIKYLDKFPILNSVYNYCDEQLKLHDYKLLRENTENIEGEGAYFSIEKGMRVYSFDSVDGFLVPIWRGVSKHTQYPDHTRKKKIIIQEDIILQQELQKYNINRKIGNLMLWGMIVTTILFGLNLWGGFKILEMNQDMEDKLHGQAFQCVENTAALNNLITTAIATKVIEGEDREKVEEKVKTLAPQKVG